MAQMKEENKTPEKQLNKMEITNLSNAELKTLVKRMFREISEYSNNITEEMKVTVSEIKKNPQRTSHEGKEAGIQINNLRHKEETNSQAAQNEVTSIQKNEERIRRLWDISKHANI